MNTLNPRRPRPTFIPIQPLPLRKVVQRRFICTATVTPSTESNSKSEQQQPTTSNETDNSPRRVQFLHTRVITRVAQAGIRKGEAAVAQTETESNSTTSKTLDNNIIILGRLKKDVRSLRRLTSEQNADQAAVELVTKLDTVVTALEKAVKTRTQKARTAELKQVDDNNVDTQSVINETASENSSNTHQTTTADDPQVDFVEGVKKKMVEQGNTLRRRASQVGEGIEEKVAEFVRDDGSIDVDGLRSFIGKFLDNAGMTWRRLNGNTVPNRKDEQDENVFEVSSKSITFRDEDKEFKLREEIGNLEKELAASSKEREAVLRKEDQLGKLIRAKEIRLMDDKVSAFRRTLAIRVLQLEMEKIFVSLAEEIENSDYEIMMEQRLVVVEFGDLDERLSTLQLFVDQDEPLLIEDDTLGELAADIQDLKTRLGLDEALYSSETLSRDQLRQFFTSSAKKTKEGADFYSRGLRLFAGDVRFVLRLIGRAIQGYSPTPREVRTLRRTGRDLLTLIPFTIVLIAPLTPVGHVLIFSFLQRYWPEFFPSTFSERRQAVMKKHEQYAKQLQAETMNAEENGTSLENSSDRNLSKKGGFWAGIKWVLLLGFLRDDDTNANTKENSQPEQLDNKIENNGSDNGQTGEAEVELDKTDKEDGKVALSDIAQSADSGKMAKRKRNAIVLEELHLAD